MTKRQRDAIQKLRDETGEPRGREQKFMAPYARDALCGFCEQSEDVAAAVLDSKMTLAQQMDAIKVGGRYFSDLDLYQQVLQRYMPSARLEYQMRVVLPAEKSQTTAKILQLDMTKLLFGGGGK